MSNVWEEYAQEYADERDKETAINLFKNGVSMDTIVKSLPTLTPEFIEYLKHELAAKPAL